jgi:hypothetical protein
MAEFELTVTGLDELIHAMNRVERRLSKGADAVVRRGALNIKKDWARRWSGLAHAPAVPRAISYDVDSSAAEVCAEIGADKQRRQGALGNILEFGTVKNAPIPAGMPALAAEEPRFVRALVEVAENVLDPGGV